MRYPHPSRQLCEYTVSEMSKQLEGLIPFDKYIPEEIAMLKGRLRYLQGALDMGSVIYPPKSLDALLAVIKISL